MMKKIINKTALIAISSILTVISVGAEAGGYGGVRSATKVCKAPKLKYKQPEEKSVIKAGDSFSAQASHKLYKNSIKASIKGTPVDIILTEQTGGAHLIEGKWPVGIEGEFARIKIIAKDNKGCKLTDGWLLKVGDAGTAEAPSEKEADIAATDEESNSSETPTADTEAISKEK